jgi:hypothetical protein
VAGGALLVGGLALARWARLASGAHCAAKSRVDWATLLDRTFDTDVRTCVRCGGRLVIRALITGLETARSILESLRRPRRMRPTFDVATPA